MRAPSPPLPLGPADGRLTAREWTARVNGAPAPCLPANVRMRAVPVPAGGSEVILTFRSTYLARGAAISLAALAVILAPLVRRRWTFRRELFRARPV